MAYSQAKPVIVNEDDNDGINAVIIALLALITVLSLGYGLLEHIRYKEKQATITMEQSAPYVQMADASGNTATSPGTGTGGDSSGNSTASGGDAGNTGTSR